MGKPEVGDMVTDGHITGRIHEFLYGEDAIISGGDVVIDTGNDEDTQGAMAANSYEICDSQQLIKI